MKKKLLLILVVFLLGGIAILCFSIYSNLSDFQKNNLNAKEEQQIKRKIKPQTFPIDVFATDQKVAPPFEMPQIQQPRFPDRICNIINYGAINDNLTLNTKAFADAIEDCEKNGGGIIEVPAGNWLTGAIRLKDNINLHLDEKAVITFSSDPKDYLPAVFSRYEGVDYIGFSPFIYADGATNIAITGKGILKGQGEKWWPRNNMNATYGLYKMAAQNIPVEKRIFDNENLMLRPSFIEFVNSDSILLEGFEITSSPMWTIHPLYSSNIVIRDVNVNTRGLNTDGIAIDSSSNVLVENSSVLSGDDAIVIKSGRDSDGLRVNKPSENIVIRNMQVSEGHSGIAFGSETSGGIRNVFIYNCNFVGVNFGIRLKSSIGRGGVVENIWANNISTGRITNTAIQLTTNYDDPYSPNDTAIPSFRNINIDSFNTSKASSAITAVGIQDNPLKKISFSNVNIKSKTGAVFSFVEDINLNKVNIENRSEEPYIFKNTKNIQLSNSDCKPINGHCVRIFGDQMQSFNLNNSNIMLNKILFEVPSQKDLVSIQ